MIVTVLNNQSLKDIAVQYTGKVSNTFFIAKANNVSVTETLIPGIKINIPETLEVDSEIVNYYKVNNITPATGVNDLENESFKGIGDMVIGESFIIR